MRLRALAWVLLGYVVFGPMAVHGGQSGPEGTPLVAAEQGEYRIGKGDTLEIFVWREPELTRTTMVRLDGMISLPLLDDVRALDRTPMELKKVIQERLGEFLESPEVTVIVNASANNKYYMVGEVNSAGEQDLIKDLTIVQALARAGGLTEWANKERIVVLRREQGFEKRIIINYKDIVSGKAPEQNILIQPNDTIIVP